MNLDKVYTNKRGLKMIKQALEENVNYKDFNQIIDPCAGSGEFKTILPVTHQYDIEPDSDNIIKKDFFKLQLNKNVERLIICSPPFGNDLEKGKRFLLRASQFSTTIGSIVSKNVEHESLIPNFKLIFKEQFKGKCFIKDGKDIDLNHYFCIWTKINSYDK